MEKKSSHIWKFIATTDVFTLATCHGGKPYCTPCFYTFDSIEKLLVFKSEARTRHITELLLQPQIAGSILPKTFTIGKVRGVQFSGKTLPLKDKTQANRLKQLYYKRFPLALPMAGELWVVELSEIKMTDNTIGFGQKLRWERSKEMSADLN